MYQPSDRNTDFCVGLWDDQSTSRCINPVIETLGSPKGYDPHISQCFYHRVDTSTGRLVVPKTHTEVSVSDFCVGLWDYQSTSRCINPVIETLTSVWVIPNGTTSTGRLVVPQGMTHTEVSVSITRLIHLLVDW
jgi:hypothetical protein